MALVKSARKNVNDHPHRPPPQLDRGLAKGGTTAFTSGEMNVGKTMPLY